jgi:hypothetical protein
VSLVRADQILPPERYELLRPAIQQRVLFEKARRRLHVGDCFTFLFENAETVRYQVQEMLRIERRSSPEDVAHEVASYRDLVGAPGELGCTLLIEIEEPALRDRKLREWLDLPERVFLELEQGARVPARFDPRQISHGRLSSVHYLRFPIGEGLPLALVCDVPEGGGRTLFTADQRAALLSDLAAHGK